MLGVKWKIFPELFEILKYIIIKKDYKDLKLTNRVHELGFGLQHGSITEICCVQLYLRKIGDPGSALITLQAC